MYDFNKIINRYNTSSEKYDARSPKDADNNLLPMWVADMDFRTADPVLDAICKYTKHGIFGYVHAPDSLYDSIDNWFLQNHGLTVKREHVVHTPGVVFAIVVAIRAFTEIGDAVMIQQPVYYPFAGSIINNGRKLVNSPLIRTDHGYVIDLDDFEKKIVENNVKMFLLCSPHNPVGRVWTVQELRAMADICLKHGVLTVSDEIHCDFVWSKHQHTMLPLLGKQYAERCILCTAPSKTFNLAGLQLSNIIITNDKLRRAFKKIVFASGYGTVNTYGIIACESAYKDGLEWLNELRSYLRGNINFVTNFIKEHLSEIEMLPIEGTYLLWLDFNKTGIPHDKLDSFILKKAGLWLDEGTLFGAEGAGFERINIACPRPILKSALEQLKSAMLKR